ERLRKLRKVIKNTKLQMLLRGQNLVGYRHYPDDVLERFINRAISNGIDILRIFDALNDIRNMEKAMKVAKAEGGHVQATISYTISPFHNLDYYLKLAQSMKDLGADSICIKDMAGIITPTMAFDLVKGLKEKIKLPVQLHSHYTSGMATMSYLKAIEAGVDVVDCAVSSLANATSQPASETMVATLENTPWQTGLDLEKLTKVAEYFKKVRAKYKNFDVADGTVDANVLRYQIPGGMISNFISQLQQANALDKLPEVLKEVPRVRADFGYPPLVTPSSQIIGSQAVLNVLANERYKMVTNEVRNYMKGLYGQPPAPIDAETRKKIIKNEEPISVRPADLLSPQMGDAKKEINFYAESEEDVLSYVLFPQVAKVFLEERLAGKTNVDFSLVNKEKDSDVHPV
ncbi:MAG: pyruvate carboxylase subunit B, partial [Clostridia bacterium]|nr:pyruvate carboxylase subunit B [Clostridia bacterium]